MNNEYKHICNVRDLLDGDINRMFVSNNKDEVTKMMYCALNLLNEEEKETKDEEKTYEQGLTDAWEAARKIVKTVILKITGGRSDKLLKIFGSDYFYSIFIDFSAAEAIAKIKAYEDKQNEIKVGDEVVENDDISKRGVVTYIKLTGSGNLYNVLWDDGQSCVYYEKGIKKTGRHFPQVEELLKAAKEE